MPVINLPSVKDAIAELRKQHARLPAGDLAMVARNQADSKAVCLIVNTLPDILDTLEKEMELSAHFGEQARRLSGELSIYKAGADEAARALSAEKAAREEAERKHLEVCAVANRDSSMLFTAERHVENLKAKLTTAEAETARLRERVKEMDEALAPFAAVAEHDIGGDETDADQFRPIQSNYNQAPKLTVGDLRRSAAIRSRENSNAE